MSLADQFVHDEMYREEYLSLVKLRATPDKPNQVNVPGNVVGLEIDWARGVVEVFDLLYDGDEELSVEAFFDLIHARWRGKTK